MRKDSENCASAIGEVHEEYQWIHIWEMTQHNLQSVSYTALGMSDDNQTNTNSYSMPSIASPTRGANARNVNFHEELNDLAGYPPQQMPAVRRFSKSFFQRPRSMSVWSDISRSSMRLDER